MAKYKLTNTGYIIDQDSGCFIPQDEANKDFVDYSEWLALGNVPDAADPSYHDTWDAARQLRNELLSKSDWSMLPDAPLSQEEKDAWVAYRQELRDIPQTFDGQPVSEIVWPSEPE